MMKNLQSKQRQVKGVQPSFSVGPIFLENFRSKKRININRGGTRSGKTYSLMQLFTQWLFTGIIEEGGPIMETGVLRVVRKFSATLESTVMADFSEILDLPVDPNDPQGEKLYDRVKHNKVKKIFEYQGRKIAFSGIDNQQKARGQKQDILYCNEANELFYQDFHQLNLRTTTKVFIDFNPDDEDIWINQELEIKRSARRGDINVIVSSYLDNPFLSDLEVEEIMDLEFVDPELWQVFGKGEYGKITGLVFPNVEVRDIPKNAVLLGYGEDWGYTNDPTTCTAIWMEEIFVEVLGKRIRKIRLYLDEIIYETGLQNTDFSRKAEALGVDKRAKHVGDSSEPKTIEELQLMGWNIRGAKKGPDSIIFGINVMKQQPFFVTPRSANIQKEVKKYKWQTDKEGKSINKPIDAFNHCFVGDTKVRTISGDKKIKDIQRGEYVLTRNGYKKVLKKWENGMKEVFTYSLLLDTMSIKVTCTPDHLIFTNLGWIKIASVTSGTTVYLLRTLTEKYTDSTEGRGIFHEGQKGFILKSGKNIMEKFQKDFKSIIKIIIPLIIGLKTLLHKIEKSICLIIQKNFIKKTLTLHEKIWKKTKINVESGTKAKQEKSGTKNMQNGVNLGKKHTESGFVKFAKNHLSQKCQNSDFVPINVKVNLEDCQESITSNENASGVKMNLQQANIQNKDFVGKLVQEITVVSDSKEEVYDLYVEGSHEYFANGLLVHNCLDGSRYFIMEEIPATKVSKKYKRSKNIGKSLSGGLRGRSF